MSLAPDEVHVWITEPEQIAEPRLLEAYWGVLNAEEREKQLMDQGHDLVEARIALEQHVPGRRRDDRDLRLRVRAAHGLHDRQGEQEVAEPAHGVDDDDAHQRAPA